MYTGLIYGGDPMALSDSWLKANNGKKRPAVQEVKDRDGLSVRISPRIKP